MTDSYDLIAIGAGPAGESAAELASFFGQRSAIVEKGLPGGTVTTTGGALCSASRASALTAPRILKDRVTCSDSSFSRTSAPDNADNHGEGRSGVAGR